MTDENGLIIERWNWIDGYDNYEVSSLGRVRSRRFLKPTNNNGYPAVNLSRNGAQKMYFVHVLVAEAFHGPRPEGMDCCHLNGDKTDNRVENLQWNTRSKNIKDNWSGMRRKLDELEAENRVLRERLDKV